ncbi:MAG: metallopeptidase TldD-related protein [Caldisericia bacterium]|nr:metallopeptidase TldD-related protein [Caldisericia bacterium]MDD4614027.1 metallopeptidase TldD-related protein [Caldisericia bacterium]
MIKEFYKKSIKDQNIKFKNDKIESDYLRTEDVTGLRLYVTGLLGVAGTAKKDFSLIELEKKALHSAKSTPYSVDCTSGLQQNIIYNYEISSEKDYKQAMVSFVEALKNQLPHCIFHGQMSLIDREESLTNEMNLKLRYKDHYIMINMYFTNPETNTPVPFFYRGRRFSRDIFASVVRTMGTAWGKEVVVKDSPCLPVIFPSANRSPFTDLFHHLHGERMGNGTSRFSGKLNRLLFHPSFTLYSSHDIENLITPFFDMEGTVLRLEEGPLSPFQRPLIQEGVLVAPYTDKRIAKKYQYPLTSNAVGAYNRDPFPGMTHFQLHQTHDSLADVLQGNTGIVVMNAREIRYSQTGEFSCQTKVAYLTDGTQLLGRVPPMTIRSNTMKMFGDDYMGCSGHILYPLFCQDVFAFRAHVTCT